MPWVGGTEGNPWRGVALGTRDALAGRLAGGHPHSSSSATRSPSAQPWVSGWALGSHRRAPLSSESPCTGRGGRAGTQCLPIHTPCILHLFYPQRAEKPLCRSSHVRACWAVQGPLGLPLASPHQAWDSGWVVRRAGCRRQRRPMPVLTRGMRCGACLWNCRFTHKFACCDA